MKRKDGMGAGGEGIRKLKFAQQIKKAEGTKTPKVSWRAI